jgi:predicted enzyme related to lactoylglutathione lyase
MKIKLTSIYVDDQEKALRLYMDSWGFAKKTDVSKGPIPLADRGLTRGARRYRAAMALNDDPAAKTYQQAQFQQGQPAAMFFTDDVEVFKARGAEFTMPPTQVTGSTVAQPNDTCGNLIQLAQLSGRASSGTPSA